MDVSFDEDPLFDIIYNKLQTHFSCELASKYSNLEKYHVALNRVAHFYLEGIYIIFRNKTVIHIGDSGNRPIDDAITEVCRRIIGKKILRKSVDDAAWKYYQSTYQFEPSEISARNYRKYLGDYSVIEIPMQNPVDRQYWIGVLIKCFIPICNIASFDYRKSIGWLFIEEPSDVAITLQISAVEIDINALKYIENPCLDVQMAAVRSNSRALGILKNILIFVSSEVINESLRNFGASIRYIDSPSDEEKLLAVSSTGSAIDFIENPSRTLQITAVRTDGTAIAYIKSPSESVQLEAARNSVFALYYIYKKGIIPSSKVLLTAVITFGNAIEYIPDPSYKLQLAAIKSDADALYCLLNKGINPSAEILAEAKEMLIGSLLSDFKYNGYEAIDSRMEILLTAQIPWAELDIIKRSVQADKSAMKIQING